MKHREAGKMVRGIFWEKGRGCAIGCTIHGYDHESYENELGMPAWLAHVKSNMFECMSDERHLDFPVLFLDSIPVGFDDWDSVYHDFCAFILRDICRYDGTEHPELAAAMDSVVRLYDEWSEADGGDWAEAAEEAEAVPSCQIRTPAWAVREAVTCAAKEGVDAKTIDSIVRATAESAAWDAVENTPPDSGESEEAEASANTEWLTLQESAAWANAWKESFDSMAVWLVAWFEQNDVDETEPQEAVTDNLIA